MKTNTHMSKTNKVLVGLVIILAVALGGVLYWQKVGFEAKYSAVYLNTGDIYFGKLSRFPRTTLRDVWFLQKEGEGQGVTLSKFENAFWGPKDRMVISEESIIWTTELTEDSEVARAIKNPQSATPAQANMAPAQPAMMGAEPQTGIGENATQ
ncbi:hypothetical protein A2372_01205 [Candidatus Wolfebacteria bacterium RIFOXYB1_FULL_54_12]|uniref:Uncharacterized protein n=1 Tax=Candidatus Wolfebacteria bacterium RIFOXYB1_FULL_54_12 TaxID=1802559 RepID=A0A1F8DWE1_9BACT|nr:MAG: hypothetical protein A2372_01205 [Candidatus Wolfebacteria bacterium RIFOXYB1_FULL_54_12]